MSGSEWASTAAPPAPQPADPGHQPVPASHQPGSLTSEDSDSVIDSDLADLFQTVN